MVLWVMVLLMVIVTEFAFSMRTEANITRNFKEDMQSYYLARAGVERALSELIPDYDYNQLDGEGSMVFVKIQPRPAGGTVAGEENLEMPPAPGGETPLGDGAFSFRIIDLEGRININRVSKGRGTLILNELLRETGVKDKRVRDTIIDSVQDWVDKDDLHRLNGAEDSYYLGLNPPYRAKDGPFSTVEELLLVRGMTEDIFYGTPDLDIEEGGYKGLVNFISVTGSSRVNINTAPEEVLKALGYGEAGLELLRSGGQRRSIPSLLSRFPRGTFRPTVKSSYFTVEATGVSEGGGKRMIRMDVWRRGGGARRALRVMRWDDNYIPRR
jgi:general secretion pathway protein K